MSEADWMFLVRKYMPKDKRICNCRQAYYTKEPPGGLNPGHWTCEAGCSANQIITREYIAKCVRRDLRVTESHSSDSPSNDI